MDNKKIYKCPKCGLQLEYDSDNKLKCQNCKITFSLPINIIESNTNNESIHIENNDMKNIKKIENIDTDINLSDKNINVNKEFKTEQETIDNVGSNFKVYRCEECKSEIISNSNVKSCIYCNSKKIEKSSNQRKLPKTRILPFKIEKKDVLNILKKETKKKILKPKQFNLKNNINRFTKVYIPSYLYNCDSNGLVELNCKKSTSWKAGSYKYKKIDTYLVTRDANMSLENIPVDTTKKFSNIIDLVGPFNYEKLVLFDTAYLDTCILAASTMTNEEILKESVGKAKNAFTEEMKNSTEDYEQVESIKNSINLYNSKMQAVLIPIWLLNIKYKNKTYTFAINGQTGKFTGDIPQNKNKLIVIWLILFVIIFIILLFICSLGVIL